MLSMQALTNPQSYSYVSGMLNIGWIAGYVRNIHTTADGRIAFSVQQTRNVANALPVVLDRGDSLPRDFAEFSPVKVTGHLYGHQEEGYRQAYLRVLYVERPTLLDMPGEMVWMSKLPEGVSPDDFRPPFPGERNGRLARAMNQVKVAGIVSSHFLVPSRTGDRDKDYLVLLIQQHEDSERAIPVRVYGKLAAQYHARVAVGAPVLFIGWLAGRATSDADGQTQQQFYLQAAHVRGATDKEIPDIPAWAAERVQRYLDAVRGRRQSAEPAAPVAEVPAPDMVANLDEELG